MVKSLLLETSGSVHLIELGWRNLEFEELQFTENSRNIFKFWRGNFCLNEMIKKSKAQVEGNIKGIVMSVMNSTKWSQYI